MSSDTRWIEREFHQRLLAVAEAAKRLKPPYHATAFRRMLADHGGRETANRLLSGSNPSQGFTELYIRGKENLRLSVEYVVLEEPWSGLFTSEQLAIARRRLRDVGCDLPPSTSSPADAHLILDEEGLPEGPFIEGATYARTVNAYERNPAARERCIAHHGAVCGVCGFDFGERYGALAQGFIQVHHLTPLATVRHAYEVDPVTDLHPVCANCHAVIHLGGACRTLEEVKQLILDQSHSQASQVGC